MKITIHYPAPSLRQSVGVCLVADGFGLHESLEDRVIADGIDVPIEAGARIAILGPSGSGKSSLLRTIAGHLAEEGARVVWPDRLRPRDVPVIDAISLPFPAAVRLLSACGLSEPRLMSQRPAELSEGERWRFRLALALSREPDWVAMDEFAATLDATLARVLAFNLKRQSLAQGCGVLAATCHEGPVADLDPDVRVTFDHDGSVGISRRNGGEAACFPCSTSSMSRPAPARIGRTSLGGITGRETSDRSGS